MKPKKKEHLKANSNCKYTHSKTKQAPQIAKGR